MNERLHVWYVISRHLYLVTIICKIYVLFHGETHSPSFFMFHSNYYQKLESCFEQGVPWHSGNVSSVSSLWNSTWHDNKTQSFSYWNKYTIFRCLSNQHHQEKANCNTSLFPDDADCVTNDILYIYFIKKIILVNNESSRYFIYFKVIYPSKHF